MDYNRDVCQLIGCSTRKTTMPQSDNGSTKLPNPLTYCSSITVSAKMVISSNKTIIFQFDCSVNLYDEYVGPGETLNVVTLDWGMRLG